MAFLATGLEAMRARLHERAMDFTERTVPSMGLYQLFIGDPSGVTIEMNYPNDEARSLGLA